MHSLLKSYNIVVHVNLSVFLPLFVHLCEPMAVSCLQDGLPMAVPEEFWEGERKLLWQAAHIEEIYECFPTIHLSMADHSNSREEFNLAIVPQVS